MAKLSVLHLSTYDNFGGSAKSARKIHQGLRRLGVDSKMLVHKKTTSDPDVDLIAKGAWKLGDLTVGGGLDRLGLHYLLYPSSFALLNHPWYRNADIVQLYNTHSGYFSHSVLPRIGKSKTLIWRLSDMWPVTGHCAYSGPCEKWKTGCSQCPDLATYPPVPRDTTKLLWNWKRLLYARTPMHIVAPSRWIKEVAEESPLFSRYGKTLIPNGIETGIYRALPKDHCRSILGLPQGKKTVLFLANGLDDPKKGGSFFIRAMNRLWENGFRDLQVMAVGQNSSGWGKDLQHPVWRHDLVGDDELLAIIYNCADIYVHGAHRENFPNTILEAMACGVPAVAFDSGGVRELIRHRETGYLAASSDAEDLSRGIQWLLEEEDLARKISERCLAAIQMDFTVEKQAGNFIELYGSLRPDQRFGSA